MARIAGMKKLEEEIKRRPDLMCPFFTRRGGGDLVEFSLCFYVTLIL
jgi:hypothetical protein